MLPTRFLLGVSKVWKGGLALLFIALSQFSCTTSKIEDDTSTQPKLIIGITVDQMRYDYLQRFQSEFNKHNGFARFAKQGMVFTDTKYEYLPTYTGPGHATIFSGTTPKHHGIIANDWYSHSFRLA